MSADVVTFAAGDLYHARMVAPHVDATIPVHAPTGRVVYQVVSPGVMRPKRWMSVRPISGTTSKSRLRRLALVRP